MLFFFNCNTFVLNRIGLGNFVKDFQTRNVGNKQRVKKCLRLAHVDNVLDDLQTWAWVFTHGKKRWFFPGVDLRTIL